MILAEWPGRHEWKPVDRALTLSVIAQALATLRCCSIVRDVIILADIFEEEDFYPNTFGFRLTPPVEDESLVELLDLAEEAMREKVRRWLVREERGHRHMADHLTHPFRFEVISLNFYESFWLRPLFHVSQVP